MPCELLFRLFNISSDGYDGDRLNRRFNELIDHIDKVASNAMPCLSDSNNIMTSRSSPFGISTGSISSATINIINNNNNSSQARSPARRRRPHSPSPPPETQFEVKEVLGRRRQVQSLVRFAGYGPEADIWLPTSSLSCPGLIQKWRVRPREREREGGRWGGRGMRRCKAHRFLRARELVRARVDRRKAIGTLGWWVGRELARARAISFELLCRSSQQFLPADSSSARGGGR